MAIVSHKSSKLLYEYLGNDKFQNLITGKEGIVGEDKAKDVFNIEVDATGILMEFPQVKELIKTLELKIKKDKG